MFFTFHQNNSGGHFHIDEKSGIGTVVIVEADSVDEANSRAEEIGLYFDGAGDCECCGQRWYSAYDEGEASPQVYGEDVVFSEESASSFVHFKSGLIKGFVR